MDQTRSQKKFPGDISFDKIYGMNSLLWQMKIFCTWFCSKFLFLDLDFSMIRIIWSRFFLLLFSLVQKNTELNFIRIKISQKKLLVNFSTYLPFFLFRFTERLSNCVKIKEIIFWEDNKLKIFFSFIFTTRDVRNFV